jgi:RNA polymerase sigma factor (sigma-70 family)
MASSPATLLRHITRRAAASAPDADLLRRFVADRDGDAFAELVRRHGPVVYRVCHRLVGPAAADDAFQAAFLVLATRAATVRKAESVGSWLVGVAGRVARQMRKAERRRAVLEAAVMAPAGESAPDRSEAAKQSRILDEELTRLSDRLRGPVVVCLLQGRTYEQAAAELGGSARTVRRRLDEAKRVLRARLERRGVVPAVAAGLIAGSGAANAAVPAGLGPGAAAAVSDFLADGATIPAAVIAKGVATAMTTTTRIVSALVATAAVGLTALGVGLAGNGPPTAPPVSPSPAAAANPALPVEAPEIHYIFTDQAGGWPEDVPSFGALRAAAGEAKFLRESIARRWLGPDCHLPHRPWEVMAVGSTNLSIPPPAPDAIRISYLRQAQGLGPLALNFAGGRLRTVMMQLSGPLDDVIDNQLPPEITRVVLNEYFGRQLGWWVDEGLGALAESGLRQAQADSRCRMAVGTGRAVRLAALFTLKEPPRDAESVTAQAHSVARFLLGRKVQPAAVEVMGAGKQAVRLPATREGTFLHFVLEGMDYGWEKAAKAVYGLDDVPAVEAAWLEWMKGRESQLARPTPTAEPAAAYPPLIPPVKLP